MDGVPPSSPTSETPVPRVLIADSSPAVAQMLAGHCTIVAAQDAGRALARLDDAGPFALVVVCEPLVGGEARELLATVQSRTPETVGILLTSTPDVAAAVEALQGGSALRYLVRPIDERALRDAVEDGLREHRRRVRERELAGGALAAQGTLWDFNAALTQRLREQTQGLQRLNRFLCDLNSAESLDEIATLAAEATSAILDHRPARIELGGNLGSISAHASSGGELSPERHVEEVVTTTGTFGMLVADLLANGRRGLSASQLEGMRAIASATAVACHNVLRRVERDEAQQATIMALARLAEQRDNETGKHLERVSMYCRLIAEGLREDESEYASISDAWIQDLVRSAPLHDIGKVGIPDAILLKPGKLTPEEWAIMKRHTEIGAQTLRDVIRVNHEQSFLQMSLDIAWCHHEKWDGSGYPRGIVGESIPLAARILALADVYDALTTSRPYKLPWTHEEALAWLREGAGTHFDPRIVDTFVAREAQADFIRARLADTPEDLVGWMRAIARAG